ncbi:hypothetical protein [uncultured Winogradskyella sp.]|uniref:hypothetical protein n=1 Tax=uncultured Winogradskyella sp. TaxID=395353 RepID=UPI0026234BDF|nr:hypothetical protein [uncultured Winogradskyella sp.]
MKTKFLTLVIFAGAVTLMTSSCSFFEGKGSITTDNNSICSNYKNSEKSELEVGLVHEMTELYQNQSRLNNDSIMAIRFDLIALKKFIYHIENEAKKQNVSSQDLGVRIYYARYPKKVTWSPGASYANDLSGFLGNSITEQYEMEHTLVMIPTRKIGSTQYDYNPFDTTTYNLGLTTSYNQLSDGHNPRKILALMPSSESRNLRKNHGEMYPPYSIGGMKFSH